MLSTSLTFVLVSLAVSTAQNVTSSSAQALITPDSNVSPSFDANTTFTVDFSSAVQMSSAAAFTLAALANNPAIPIPGNLSDDHPYSAIADLIPALPAIPLGVHFAGQGDEISAMLADMISANDTGSGLEARANALRVMIVGDSMTAGKDGDYTWRYRMWQWFQQNNVAVQFVGTYSGTVAALKPSPPQPPPLFDTASPAVLNPQVGGYAADVDPAFLSNSNHYAYWGRPVALDQNYIQDVIQNLQGGPPDILLVMLGFNDLGWFYSDANGLIVNMGNFIANARKAAPNVKFAIANVPQRSFIGGREDLVENTNIYNNLLPQQIPKWSTPQSPVNLVYLAQTYSCSPSSCPAGYDGLHPDNWGDFEIANAFSACLVNNYGIGSAPLAIPNQNDPSVQRNLPVPSNFKVFSSPQGVTATWDAVLGAYSYDVDVSINGGGGGFSAGSVEANRWDSTWPLPGWSYQVSVRASAGNTIKGSYTSPQSAVASPQLAPPPRDIQVQPTGDGFTVTFDPPTGPYTDSIVEYNIIIWDVTDSCQIVGGGAFKSSPATFTGLNVGSTYLIFPLTWNANGQGLPETSTDPCIPGGGTPAPPTGFQVISNDPTSVHMQWDAMSGAAGYRVWMKNINNSTDFFKIIANTSSLQTCNDEYFLFPGVWNYDFKVSAHNGVDESAQNAGMVAPSPASTVTEGSPGPTCPAPPGWCQGPPPSNTVGVNNGGTVVGGTTTVISGSTTVIGGTTTTIAGGGGGSTSVVGGTTTVISGHTTVVGGSTTTIAGTFKPTSTADPATYPQCSGSCAGPDCHNGQCYGVLCACFGCSGSDCHNNVCTGPSCIPVGCLGSNCVNGVCTGPGCVTDGCIGPGCGSDGKTHGSTDGSDHHCHSLLCYSVGCVGLGCSGAGGSGICSSPQCSEISCSGSDCVDGGCDGQDCTPGITFPGGEAGGTGPNPSPSPTSTPTSCASEQTATDCTFSLSYATNNAGTITSTSTSSTCKATTGCGVTASSTTITPTTGAQPTNIYAVYPTTPQDAAQAQRIVSYLLTYVPSADFIIASQPYGAQPVLWWVMLTPAQAQNVTNENSADIIFGTSNRGTVSFNHIKSETSTNHSLGETAVLARHAGAQKRAVAPDVRFGEFSMRDMEGSDWSLPFISVRPGADLASAQNQFWQPYSKGNGMIVYVVDSGIDASAQWVADALGSGRLTSLWYRQQFASETPIDLRAPFDGDQHGTAMVSKILHPSWGSAVSASVVSIKDLPVPEGAGEVDAVVAGINTACNHFRFMANKPSNAILSLSLTVYLFNPNDPGISAMRTALQSCVGLGILPVVAAGNEGNNNLQEDYPQLFASMNDNTVPEMLVIGGMDQSGNLWAESTGGATAAHLFAPGVKVAVAAATAEGDFTIDGTSAATAQVAGVLANMLAYVQEFSARFLAQGYPFDGTPRNTLLALRDLLLQTCKEKGPSYFNQPVLWNGVNGLNLMNQRAAACNPPTVPKRSLFSRITHWLSPGKRQDVCALPEAEIPNGIGIFTGGTDANSPGASTATPGQPTPPPSTTQTQPAPPPSSTH